ncbi:MAG: tetratricopeptide repeat protein [Candidatus Sericytochromatia bacterium]
MRVILSPAVAWQSAPDWDKHRNYYLQSGADVFLKQEVPYNITSNPCFTAQSAQCLKVLLATHPPEQPFRILELGAGLGLYALHLLESLCLELNPESQAELPNLEYWLTDLAPGTLAYLAQQPVIQAWQNRGKLQLAVFDALTPMEITPLKGEARPLEPGFFHALIANYHFSTLPTAVLYKQPLGWYQKTVQRELDLEDPALLAAFVENWQQALRQRNWLEHLPTDHPQWRFFQTLQTCQSQWASEIQLERLQTLPKETELRAWLQAQLSTDLHKALLETEAIGPETEPQSLIAPLEALLLGPFFDIWLEHDLPTYRRDGLEAVELSEICPDPRSAAVLSQLTEHLPLATVSYPLLALELLDALLPALAKTACLLISDKGYADQDWMHGMHQEDASHHGDSLSHPVNFPLLAALCESRGFNCLRTTDPVYALQTLWATRSPAPLPDWQKTFSQAFVEHNANEESHAWLEAGHQFLKLGEHERATRCLTRALRLRPNDATLLYLMSVNLLQQEKYLQAWAYLNSPHDDYFGLFNFAVLKAETCRLLEQYADALPFYQEALQRYGAASTVLYNLGLCYEALEQPLLARDTWQAALDLNPEDTEIQASLAELKPVLL